MLIYEYLNNFLNICYRYSPSWEDDGLYLSCRSANAEYPDITREDGYILDIKCKSACYRKHLNSRNLKQE